MKMGKEKTITTRYMCVRCIVAIKFQEVSSWQVDHGEVFWSTSRDNDWPMIFSWWPVYTAVDGYHLMHTLGNSQIELSRFCVSNLLRAPHPVGQVWHLLTSSVSLSSSGRESISDMILDREDFLTNSALKLALLSILSTLYADNYTSCLIWMALPSQWLVSGHNHYLPHRVCVWDFWF